MLLDVSDQVLLGKEGGFRTQKGSSTDFSIFRLSVFIKKRRDGDDGKDESVGFFSKFFSSSVSSSQKNIMVEKGNSTVKEEFGFPEHLGKISEIFIQNLRP